MFVVLKAKGIFKWVALVLCSVLLVSVSAATDSVAAVNGKRLTPVYRVATDEKAVALTFDAAWGADKTKKIMEILKKYDADATFFLVGFWIAKYPDETKAIAANGFEIGNHSNNHLNMSKLNSADIKLEIESVNNEIARITGKTPRFFRPPFGDYNNTLIECVQAENMVAVQWDVDSLDWKGLSGEQIAKRVLPRVKNGSIVLFHNNSDYVLEALEIILPKLKDEGYKTVSVDELVLTKNYVVDSAGEQHGAA